ncbi:unnamed protein product [Lupinus luteus]|uniref:Uncharacterized protein n=1 Tax=Lupinus luteus TaxID=3873 RepID=A0AAV1WN86_LUPLU
MHIGGQIELSNYDGAMEVDMTQCALDEGDNFACFTRLANSVSREKNNDDINDAATNNVQRAETLIINICIDLNISPASEAGISAGSHLTGVGVNYCGIEYGESFINNESLEFLKIPIKDTEYTTSTSFTPSNHLMTPFVLMKNVLTHERLRMLMTKQSCMVYLLIGMEEDMIVVLLPCSFLVKKRLKETPKSVPAPKKKHVEKDSKFKSLVQFVIQSLQLSSLKLVGSIPNKVTKPLKLTSMLVQVLNSIFDVG